MRNYILQLEGLFKEFRQIIKKHAGNSLKFNMKMGEDFKRKLDLLSIEHAKRLLS